MNHPVILTLALTLSLAAADALLCRCRRSPDPCAHSEYDRYALARAHCEEHLRPLRCGGLV